MKTGKNMRIHFFSLLIIALIAAVYLLSMAATAEASLISMGSGPVYRGTAEGVALACVVRYEADLTSILEAAEEAEIPMTFFVTASWAREQAELLQKIKQQGHQCALLGQSGSPADLEEELRQAQLLGLDSRLYMPREDAIADKFAKKGRKIGCRVVLSSIDVLQSSTHSEKLVQRIAENWFPGAIIRFEPVKTMREAFAAAVEELQSQGAAFYTVSGLIEQEEVV
jgi:hypothetical protein